MIYLIIGLGVLSSFILMVAERQLDDRLRLLRLLRLLRRRDKRREQEENPT